MDIEKKKDMFIGVLIGIIIGLLIAIILVVLFKEDNVLNTSNDIYVIEKY